ncbi:MAG: four helix bundle protein [Anaerolineae bacterium]
MTTIPISHGHAPQSYRDLEIFQTSRDLAIRVHRMTLEQLPKFEMFEEGGQIRRSCKAIEMNIVEGFGRKHYHGEYIKYLTYSLAECDETKEHLDILYKTGSLTDEAQYRELYECYQTLGRKIYRFRESVMRSEPIDS